MENSAGIGMSGVDWDAPLFGFQYEYLTSNFIYYLNNHPNPASAEEFESAIQETVSNWASGMFTTIHGQSFPSLIENGFKWSDNPLRDPSGFYQMLLRKLSELDPSLLDPFTDFLTKVVNSFDPNGIQSPMGVGPQRLVSPNDWLDYTIQFENDPAKATAPAQVVRISEQLDSNLDWKTFSFGSMGFGTQQLDASGNATAYKTRLDLRTTIGLYVDVSAKFDPGTGRAVWEFTSVDPSTGEASNDPYAGFLPPDLDGIQGSGWVTYSISPKATIATGTRLNATAQIIFDSNDPIDTPTAFNTVDADAPTSAVSQLPPQSPGDFTVQWLGQDNVGGAGLDTYDVYVSDNGAPAALWLSNVSETQDVYPGVQDHSYGFYSIAHDAVGNLEPPPLAPDAFSTVVDGIAPHVVAAEFEGSTPVIVQGRYLTIQFSENVQASLTLADIKVHNATTGLDIVPAGMSYHAASNTAIVTFGSPLTDGNYALTIDGSKVADAAGNLLDGDHDGNAGGDFVFSFFSLLGDVNRDRTVDDQDLSLVTAALGTAGVRPQDGDANGDGYVNFADLVAVAQHYGNSNTTLLDGDFNGDGKVDFTDLVVVAQHYGRGGRTDLNGDGIVNQADLDIINANFGHTLPAAGVPIAASPVASVAAPIPLPVTTSMPISSAAIISKPVSKRLNHPLQKVLTSSQPAFSKAPSARTNAKSISKSLAGTFSTMPIKEVKQRVIRPRLIEELAK